MASPLPLIGMNTDSYMSGGSRITGMRPEDLRSITEAGGIPVIVPPISDPDTLQQILAPLDGFVMIGGDDIPAEMYGERQLPTCSRMEKDREASDFVLLEALIRGGVPTLAICLGFQELNVHCGGALYQDILFDGPPTDISHYSKKPSIPVHEVRVEAETRLAKALGIAGMISVNSKHHQAVSRLGSGLRVSAKASDGIVEAIELEDHPFFIAVQWHPEQMEGDSLQKKLF